jgi:hypothetical protein
MEYAKMEKYLNKQMRKGGTKCYEEFNKNPFHSEVEFKITRGRGAGNFAYESFKELLEKKTEFLREYLENVEMDVVFTVNCDAWSATDCDGKPIEWAITVEWESDVQNPFCHSNYPWSQSFQEYDAEQ